MESNEQVYYWLPHPTQVAAPALLIEKTDKHLILQDIDGKKVQKNIDQCIQIHKSCFDGVNDLLSLSDFNEYSSLHNIKIRYEKDQIYTRVGQPILVALNPYKKIPLYTKEIALQYKKKMNSFEDNMEIEPHLFQISEMGFQQLFETNQNQAIVISGESGSGKTESTKIILKYLANDHTSSQLKQKKGKNYMNQLLQKLLQYFKIFVYYNK